MQLEFVIPGFLGWTAPQYRCNGGPLLPAVRSGYPELAPELQPLIDPDPAARRQAWAYRRLQLASWLAGIAAGGSLGLGLLIWRFFRLTMFLPNGLLLTALSVTCSYLAYRRFHRLASVLTDYWAKQPEAALAESGFRHYDVTPQGIFPRSGGFTGGA